MDHIARSSLSKYQIFIVEQRLKGKTYEETRLLFYNEFQVKLYDNKISTAIKRACVGYFWEPGMKGGTDPYLCKEDFEELKEEVIIAQEYGHPFDCCDVIDEAQRIKMNRIQKGIAFLKRTNSENLMEKLNSLIIKPPTRPWINGILKELDAHIVNRRLVDEKRLDSCSFQIVNEFFNNFSDFIKSFKKFLIFGADETMVEPLPRKSYVIPNKIKVVLHEKYPDMRHITAMMCHCVSGPSLPPFIILTNLQNIPSELLEFCETQQIYLSSSPNGYMTRDLFLIWSLHFINYICIYRDKLLLTCQNSPVLLILDGHTSRENPLALDLLRRFNISVLIIPSHTSHILQMFDVVLGYPLKSTFSDKFEKLLKDLENDKSISTYTSKIRLAAIKALISAWTMTSNPIMTEKSAKITGIYPINPDEVKKSVFVHELSEQEKNRFIERQKRNQNRINISGQIITSHEKIEELANRIKNVTKFTYLCNIEDSRRKSYIEIVQDILSETHNDCKLLSRIPKIPASYYSFYPKPK